jgi:hypothetical protein
VDLRSLWLRVVGALAAVDIKGRVLWNDVCASAFRYTAGGFDYISDMRPLLQMQRLWEERK